MDYYKLGYNCPYFKKTHADRVSCERGSCVRFLSHSEAKKFLHKYCDNTNGWKDCSIAKMLNDYYEDEYDETD